MENKKGIDYKLVLLINGIEYDIRRDYLHRGNTPRIVLNKSHTGNYINVAFEYTREVRQDLKEWEANRAFTKIFTSKYQGLMYNNHFKEHVCVQFKLVSP